MVFEPVEQGIYEGFSLEEVVPLGIVQVGGDNGGFAAVPVLHELEKAIDLFGVECEVSQFVNHQQIVPGKAFDELWSAPVRE